MVGREREWRSEPGGSRTAKAVVVGRTATGVVGRIAKVVVDRAAKVVEAAAVVQGPESHKGRAWIH